MADCKSVYAKQGTHTGCLHIHNTVPGAHSVSTKEVLYRCLSQVAFLRSALGALAVPCPTLNVGTAFSAIINAALGSKATSYAFSPYDNDLDFLLGAFLFEDVGVTAVCAPFPLPES